MPAAMKLSAVVSFLFTVILFLLECIGATITFGTICYHFTMRLSVGFVVNQIMHNQANYSAPWFEQQPWEPVIYRILQVNKWKKNLPTYDPSLFDRRKHTVEEIVQATCQAEIVHEVIFVLSFLPLLAAIPFGSFAVFFITSLLSACFDMIFVIIQRFNRPRLIRILNKKARN